MVRLLRLVQRMPFSGKSAIRGAALKYAYYGRPRDLAYAYSFLLFMALAHVIQARMGAELAQQGHSSLSVIVGSLYGAVNLWVSLFQLDLIRRIYILSRWHRRRRLVRGISYSSRVIRDLPAREVQRSVLVTLGGQLLFLIFYMRQF